MRKPGQLDSLQSSWDIWGLGIEIALDLVERIDEEAVLGLKLGCFHERRLKFLYCVLFAQLPWLMSLARKNDPAVSVRNDALLVLKKAYLLLSLLLRSSQLLHMSLNKMQVVRKAQAEVVAVFVVRVVLNGIKDASHFDDKVDVLLDVVLLLLCQRI